MNLQTDLQDLNGTPPQLEGSICERLLVQEFWYDRKLEEEANLIHLKADGQWFRLYFDCGIIFWRRSKESQIKPFSFTDDAECENAFRIRDIGSEFSLNNLKIDQYQMDWQQTGASVSFRFEDGSSITFEDIADNTSIKAEQYGVDQAATPSQL